MEKSSIDTVSDRHLTFASFPIHLVSRFLLPLTVLEPQVAAQAHSQKEILYRMQCFGSGSALILAGRIRIHEGKKTHKNRK
jgi:hypothetical protein